VVVILTTVALRRMDSRNSSRNHFSHTKCFPEPQFRIQAQTPSHGSGGAAATAYASATARVCQAFARSPGEAAALGAPSALGFASAPKIAPLVIEIRANLALAFALATFLVFVLVLAPLAFRLVAALFVASLFHFIGHLGMLDDIHLVAVLAALALGHGFPSQT